MKLLCRIAVFAVIASLAATIANSQSLGDVARQEKVKKNSSPAAKRPTVTNDDIPSAPEGTTSDAAAEDNVANPPHKTGTPKSREAAAAQFKARIKQQKQRVSLLEVHVKDLQKAMDRWKTSDCTHVLRGDGSNACDRLQKLTDEYDRSQSQLDKARAALSVLQDDARRAGFGVQVYDPD